MLNLLSRLEFGLDVLIESSRYAGSFNCLGRNIQILSPTYRVFKIGSLPSSLTIHSGHVPAFNRNNFCLLKEPVMLVRISIELRVL